MFLFMTMDGFIFLVTIFNIFMSYGLFSCPKFIIVNYMSNLTDLWVSLTYVINDFISQFQLYIIVLKISFHWSIDDDTRSHGKKKKIKLIISFWQITLI